MLAADFSLASRQQWRNSGVPEPFFPGSVPTHPPTGRNPFRRLLTPSLLKPSYPGRLFFYTPREKTTFALARTSRKFRKNDANITGRDRDNIFGVHIAATLPRLSRLALLAYSLVVYWI
jgi:hypothetical protein